HTSFSRDWSSDVCSSDLSFHKHSLNANKRIWGANGMSLQRLTTGCHPSAFGTTLTRLRQWKVLPSPGQATVDIWNRGLHSRSIRSEERRVGKECSSRGAT